MRHDGGDSAGQLLHPELRTQPRVLDGLGARFFQWASALRFDQIGERVPIEGVRALYMPYHETNILQFVDQMDELCRTAASASTLKRARLRAGLTQKRLAELSGVPLRTVQQYEQWQKDINKAQAASVFALARVLHCEPESLLEHVPQERRDYAWMRL